VNRRHPIHPLRREADRQRTQRTARRGLAFAAACAASFALGSYWPNTDHSEHWSLVRTEESGEDAILEQHLDRDSCLHRMFEMNRSAGCAREGSEHHG
jgi:hypothetical protein